MERLMKERTSEGMHLMRCLEHSRIRWMRTGFSMETSGVIGDIIFSSARWIGRGFIDFVIYRHSYMVRDE